MKFLLLLSLTTLMSAQLSFAAEEAQNVCDEVSNIETIRQQESNLIDAAAVEFSNVKNFFDQVIMADARGLGNYLYELDAYGSSNAVLQGRERRLRRRVLRALRRNGFNEELVNGTVSSLLTRERNNQNSKYVFSLDRNTEVEAYEHDLSSNYIVEVNARVDLSERDKSASIVITTTNAVGQLTTTNIYYEARDNFNAPIPVTREEVLQYIANDRHQSCLRENERNTYSY